MAKDSKGHGSNGKGGAKASTSGGSSTHKYNASSVDKAINSAYRGKKPPTSKQRSVTHALLKGRG